MKATTVFSSCICGRRRHKYVVYVAVEAHVNFFLREHNGRKGCAGMSFFQGVATMEAVPECERLITEPERHELQCRQVCFLSDTAASRQRM